MNAIAITAARQPLTLTGVISSLGTDEFERETLQYLNAVSGAEHYCVYRVREGRPKFLGGASVRGKHAISDRSAETHWPERSYIELHEVEQAVRSSDNALVFHEDVEQIADPTLHAGLKRFHIVDRVMMCGRAVDDLYALSVMRSRESGQFAEQELHDLAENADLLVAFCAKHAQLHWDRAKTIAHFASVNVIETNLRTSDWGLTERELQVSARILFGISAYGISIDLGLGEETIATYRKRLYARLHISGRHELMQRYLTLL
ncbi:MAG: helix-turn-helix transcriptional regulator [Sphingopyxis sp.]|uniref:helix-turn-helix transcriptional regulator n=1 Tax=Sphingopyxis sp. TaxID=1908224 RepID=UPI001A18C38A|nr:helix-turn-helix transcriptional regulator [Sphingopyxis sp.]MBJ7499331.1 helix-turn-helix transcriptional regulator [Sphingopyxis sp.]